MAGAMDELVAEAPIGDHLASDGIDFLGGQADLHCIGLKLLCRLQHRVEVPELIGGPLVGVARHPERSRRVRLVALDVPADVEQQRLARLDYALAGLVMWR